MTENQRKLLDEATNELESSFQTYNRLEQEESKARSEAIACRNKLNTAQKAFDNIVKEIRESAPVSSDWRQQEQYIEAPANTVTTGDQP